MSFISLDRKKFRITPFDDVMRSVEKLFVKREASVARSLMLLIIGQACKTYLKSLPLFGGVKRNYFRIFGTFFYCQTENGFNNALYELVDPCREDKSGYRRMVTSWPKKYPALVSFDDQSFEAGRVYVEWVPLINLRGSDLPEANGCHFCYDKKRAETEGVCVSRGTMWMRYSSKTKNWSIECPKQNDYSIIHYCPNCGRSLMEETNDSV